MTAQTLSLAEQRAAFEAVKLVEGIDEYFSNRDLLRFLQASGYKVDGRNGAPWKLRRTIAFRATSLAPSRSRLLGLDVGASFRGFRLLSKANTCGRKIVHCSIAALQSTDAAPWSSKGPRCYGTPGIMQQCTAFARVWEEACRVQNSEDPDDPIILVDVSGATRTPTALLQRLSLQLGWHYPGRVHKVVVHPASPRLEQHVNHVLPFADAGGVARDSLVCVADAEALSKELSLAAAPGRHLTLADLAAEVSAEAAGSSPSYSAPSASTSSSSSAGVLEASLNSMSSTDGPASFFSAPWCPKGVDAALLSLEEEITDFASFVLITPQEAEIRAAFCARLGDEVRKTSRHASTALVGPGGFGLCVEGDALQIGAGGVEAAAATEAALACGATKVERVSSSQLHCVFQGLSVDVMLGWRNDLGRKCTAEILEFLDEFAPGAATAYVVLRCILKRAKLVDDRTGGLTAEALMVMIAHVCRVIQRGVVLPCFLDSFVKGEQGDRDQMMEAFKARRGLNSEKVLRTFVTYYSSEFNYASCAVSDATADVICKGCASADLFVLTLVGKDYYNLANDCTRVLEIQQQFLKCAASIAATDAKLRSSHKPSSPKAALGRSTLSHLVSRGDSFYQKVQSKHHRIFTSPRKGEA
ncbi:hypothetical protein DIPPA_00985 [Diplonema papillatum]|nr:hypothetical protein DIPPA_00985 [Diplonema papillatum]